MNNITMGLQENNSNKSDNKTQKFGLSFKNDFYIASLKLLRKSHLYIFVFQFLDQSAETHFEKII
jgi:hypothetical protein